MRSACACFGQRKWMYFKATVFYQQLANYS